MVLVGTTLVHDGFPSEGGRTLVGAKTGRQTIGGGKQTVPVSLRTLSQSIGGTQSCATIDFAPELDKFLWSFLPLADC